jgi:hypothetical protein
LAPGNRIEAVVIAGRGDGRDADLVVVERQIDVNGISLDRDAEGLGETEARVEGDGAFKILAKEDDLGVRNMDARGIYRPKRNVPLRSGVSSPGRGRFASEARDR